MGATWDTKSMFDLDTVEDSLADILNQKDIETYAFDIFGGGQQINNKSIIGNLHPKNVEYANEIIKEHNIDFVFGHSYGAPIAQHAAMGTSVKGLMFFDPFPTNPNKYDIKRRWIDDFDKVVFTKSNITAAMLKYSKGINPVIWKDHLDALCDGEVFVTASYTRKVGPKIFNEFYRHSIISEIPKRVFYSFNCDEDCLDIYDDKVFIPDASHWIALEPFRYQLSEEIVKFIDYHK